MASKGEAFVTEFVIGLGLFSGLWISTGVDPEGAVLDALATAVNQLVPNPLYGVLFVLISIVSTLVSILSAYALGGFVGIFAVIMALLGGVFLNSGFGAYLIVIGLFVGLIAPAAKEELGI